MGLLDVKIEVSYGSKWSSRNQRLERLKSVVVRSSLQPSTDDNSGDVYPANMPDELNSAAAENDVDALIGIIEQVSTEKVLAFMDVLQLVDASGNTLLHIAAINNCNENVKLLIYHAPALILNQNLFGDTPLHVAIRNSVNEVKFAFAEFMSYKVKSWFYKEWINVVGTLPDIRKSLRIRNRNGNTALHETVIKPNYFYSFFTFVDQDPEVCYFRNNEGKSPLQLAAQIGEDSYLSYMRNHLRKIGLKEPRSLGRPPLIPVVLIANEDAKTEVSSGARWIGRNKKLGRLKSEVVKSSDNTLSPTSSHRLCNGEIHSADPSPRVVQEPPKGAILSEDLCKVVMRNDVDSLICTIEEVMGEKELTFSDILQLLSTSGNTLLHIAVMNHCFHNVKFLLYHAPGLMLKQNLVGDTPLHLAVRYGDGLVMCVFMDFMRYKNAPGFHEKWIAVAGTIPEMEKSVRISNSNGNTAPHEAVVKPYLDTVVAFVHQDPQVCYMLNNQGQSPLYLAAEAGQEAYVSYMLRHLKEIGFKELIPRGSPPLLTVVLKVNKDFIDKILEYEPALINLLDEDGKTPLHYAASIGCTDTVQYILGKNAEYALVRDQNGFFPIHMAAAHGNIKVIRLFLKRRCNAKELLTHTAQNILHIAAANGKIHVVRFLLQTPSMECLINEGDIDGNTPLHLATINWRTKVVSAMTWDKRVDLGYVNREGFTALDAAEYYMERPPTFDKRLTWTALKAAGTPQSQAKHLSGPSKSQPSTNVDMDNYKDRVNTLLVVATLVATVTFAAGFTMPGGYNNPGEQNQGMATMLRNKAFYIFIFSNTIAMYTSILVAISLIWAQLGDINLVFIALRIAIPLLGAGLSMMSLAFMAGVYLVVSQLQWLGYTVLITGLAFLAALLLLFFPLCFPISSRCRVLRYFSYYPFQLLILVTSRPDD